MAVNIQKFLPSSKGTSSALSKVTKTISKNSTTGLIGENSQKNIGIIRVKVIEIDKILKGTLASQKKDLDDKKKKESGKRREEQEKKLETKPNAEKGKIEIPKIPRMGFLDWVKNFIGNIILGYFAVRLVDHLPKIIPIVKFLGQATDFVIDIGGKLLNGLVTFIDWGYKAYDATRGFLKNFGGEGFAKGFDKFIGVVDTALFLTSVLAADLALEAATGGGDGGGLGDIIGDQLKKRVGQQAARQVGSQVAGQVGKTVGMGAGTVAAVVAGVGLLSSALGEGSFQVKKVSQGFEKTVDEWGNASKKDKNPITRAMKMATWGMFGPMLRFGNWLLNGIGVTLDIIGAPFRYAIELLRYPFLSEEDKIKQANNLAKFDARIRDGIREHFAGFLSPLLRLVGKKDWADGLDKKGSMGSLFGERGTKGMGYRSGGITRAGKAQTGAKRTIGGIKKGKYKRELAKEPSKVRVKDKDKSVKETTEQLDKTKYFGPILAVSSKIIAKEEPTQNDYENVGLGLNLLISKGIEEKQLKGGLIAAFAEGGMVDSDFLEAAEKGADVSSWISATFKSEFETNAQKTLRLIKEKKEKKGDAGVPGPGQPGSPDMVNIQGGDADFWTLVAVASREDGEPQAWADVAQSIYNRLASGAYSGKTIKDLILGQMQYEPTWKFPKPGSTGRPNQEWYAIKDAASAGIAAGQPEGAMKKVAAAILDPTLQKNAREFIQGRTDFRGYSVSGGVQRKPGDNYYGWYNNYTANKIGSVPNFGATTISGGAGPGGTFVGGGTGSGYGSGGEKIAGDLGDFMKANKGKIGVTGEIHQHPRHPGQFRRGYFSYHNQNRALDIGGWGPAHPSSGGRDEQAPVIRALLEWNKKNGYTPVEIIHGSPAFKGLGKYESAPNALHSNHVHVAYAKGGRVRKPTFAMLGEKGPEFVFDADTTAGLDRLAPGILEKLNVAKTKPQLASILQSYATYEQPYSEPEIVEIPVPMPMMIGGDYESSGGFGMIFGGDEENDSFDSLYVGG